MNLFGSLKQLVSVVWGQAGQLITLRPNQSVTYTTATDIQTPPSTLATQILVSADSTQTITNKTISGASNTLTNIPGGSVTGTVAIANGGTGQTTAAAAYNALSPMTTTGDLEYEASAGIAARLPIGSTGQVLTVASGAPTWVAPATSGTVTSVQVSGGTTGLTTSGGPITTNGTITLAGILTPANGGTGTTTTTGTGSAVLATSPSLTTPSVAGATISNYLDFTEQGSAPAAPAASTLRVFTQVGDTLATINSAGTVTTVGTGSGQKNYTAKSTSTATGWTGFGSVTPSTNITAASLPRAQTTKTGLLLNPSGSSGTFTVSIATPAVFTATAHGMKTGFVITFSTSGALPTGLTAGTPYYVNVVSSSTFNVATTMANLIAGVYVATSGTQSGTQTYTYGGAYTQFTLDAADYGVVLQAQWAQNILSGVTGDWEVDFYSNTASNYSGTYTRLTLSTDTNGSTLLPNLEGTVATTFSASNATAPYIEMRWNKVAADTDGLVVSDIIVGPGAIVQGPSSIGPVQATAVTGSWVSNATYTAKETQIGTWAFYQIEVALTGAPTATALIINLPTNRTIDTTALANTTGNGNILPHSAASLNKFGVAAYAGSVLYNSTTAVAINYSDRPSTPAVSIGNAVTATAPVTFASGDTITVSFAVPIAQFAGSASSYYGNNSPQYASNSNSTNTATDSTSFAYGPAGSNIPNGAVGTQYQRVVQFTSPIQPTDQLILEGSTDGLKWAQFSDRFGAPTTQNSVSFGVQVVATASNQATVYFQAGGANPGATYGSNGTAWSSYTSFFWRLKKFSSGQAVGFGQVVPGISAGLVPPTGLPGQTNGVAIPAGTVGETPTKQTGSVTATITFAQWATITLQPGVWLLSGSAMTDAGSATGTYIELCIATTGGNSTAGTTLGYDHVYGAINTTSGAGQAVIPAKYVNISTATAYFLNGRSDHVTTTDIDYMLQPIRIA